MTLTIDLIPALALLIAPVIAWYMGKEKGRREAADEAESWGTRIPVPEESPLDPFFEPDDPLEDKPRYKGKHRKPHFWNSRKRVVTA